MAKKLIPIFLVLLIMPLPVLAQDKDNTHRHENYVKFGFLHGEGEISSIDYVVNGISVEFETYFSNNHFQLSGWTIGYHKENLYIKGFDHLINAKVFRTIGSKKITLKSSLGVEYGSPSDRYDNTIFYRDNENDLSYRHLSLTRNSNIPKFSRKYDGVIYPFFEVGITARKGIFIFETGIRTQLMKFGVDSFDITPPDTLQTSSKNKLVPVPFLFTNIGIRIGK